MKEKVFISILLVSSIIATLFCCELYLRFNKSSHNNISETLLRSAPNFELDSNGALRLAKNSQIREVALFGKQIEYDVIYKTNNEGFIDPMPYDWNKSQKESSIALVGDSFSAGVGSREPWVPKTRELLKKNHSNMELFNLSIPGSGIVHFQKILSSVSKQKSFSTIVIIAISNDFGRPFYIPKTREISLEQNQESIIELSNQLNKEHSTNPQLASQDISQSLEIIQMMKSTFVRFPFIRSLLESIGLRRKRTTLPLEATNILSEIKKQFSESNIYLIHLPEKQEMWKSEYDLEIKERVEAMGIAYFPALTNCVFTKDSYFPNDSHPSQKGYQDIEKCVTNYLDKVI